MSERRSWWEEPVAGGATGGGAQNSVAEDCAAAFGVIRLPSIPRQGRAASRLSKALFASVIIHALLAIGLFLHAPARTFGSPGADTGTGIQVSLVAGFAGGSAAAASQDQASAEATPIEAEQQPTLKASPRGGADSEPIPAAEPSPPQLPRLAMARSTPPGSVGEFEGRQGASDAQGGDPIATSDLIGQIARCLPPTLRPQLAFANLTMAIGPDGRLMRPPEVIFSLPALGVQDRALADRVVQAALLCGPYAHPDARGRVVTLPADFSAAS